MRAELTEARARMQLMERDREERLQALEEERRAREDAESEPFTFPGSTPGSMICVC